MYFFISALRGLAISWLSTAVCTTTTAALQAWRFVVCILPLFLASELVRYIICEYQAVVAVLYVDLRALVALGLAIGSLPRAIDLLLSCICDLFGHTIAIARGTWLMVAAISNVITKAMRKITCRRIYEVVAWLCFVLLCIYVAFALLFAAGTTVVAAQALSAMWVSASSATPESISLAATFAVGLCFWIPFILYCCRHLLLLYMQVVTPIIAAVLVCAGEITMPTYMSLWSI